MGAAALALFNLLPSVLKLFGQEKPAEIVEKAVGVAKIITGTQTPESALEVLQADPEKMAQFIAEGEERSITWFKLYVEDTQSARERDIKLQQAGIKNNRANALVVFAFVLLAFSLAVVIWTSELNEYAKGILTLFVGRALGWIEQVYSFEFGTTRSSKQKDATIEKQAEGLMK